MKNFMSTLGAILIMAAMLSLFVAGILAHVEGFDPQRLHQAVTGRLQYPDNLFGGGK